ncbi:MAG: hypothetical protein AAF690_22100 [Acidobacteriota bacterium]
MNELNATWACTAPDCDYTEPAWQGHYCAWCGSDLMPVHGPTDGATPASVDVEVPDGSAVETASIALSD